jgi:uncharacterized membrane protein
LKTVKFRLIVLAAVVALAVLALIVIDPAERPRCVDLESLATISVPLDSLGIGKPKFFCVDEARGEKLRFVLARGTDGRVRAAFDACRQCYKYHEGFTSAAGELVCRLCGNLYPVDRMTIGKASCAPVQLLTQVSGANVTIRKADLVKGKALF